MLKKERLRAETEMERHRSLAQMVAGVAHEINTPLGIVNHAASIITDELSEDQLDELAKDEDALEILNDLAEAGQLIQSNIARASKLITSFKKLSSRQVTDSIESVNIRSVVDETVDLYRIKARASHLKLNIVDEIGETDRPWIGYPGHLSQIVLNLITNIDRYAYPDGSGGVVDSVVCRMATIQSGMNRSLRQRRQWELC